MSIKKLHVDRIKPEFSVSESGMISWKAGLTDYDASLFYRGKTVTNEEFNKLFLNKTYQNNYLADSLTELFNTHLPESISRTFTSRFNLRKSFIKTFDSAAWGSKQADGYYYISIPASEHGIELSPELDTLEGMNVDTEMYLLDETTGAFYEVTQVETDTENTVRIYTDDNTLSGFVVIRTNDKSFALAEGRLDVSQIDGLASVAKSGNYEDLKFKPDDRITANENAIAKILSDTAPTADGFPFVHKADYATKANEATYAANLLGSGTIQNQPISAIFEEASYIVKRATMATVAADYTPDGGIANKFNNILTGATSVNNAVNAINADNSIKTPEGNYKGFVLNENGVLKFEDIIVPQKKLIWEGALLLDATHVEASRNISDDFFNNVTDDMTAFEFYFKVQNGSTSSDYFGIPVHKLSIYRTATNKVFISARIPWFVTATGEIAYIKYWFYQSEEGSVISGASKVQPGRVKDGVESTEGFRIHLTKVYGIIE